MIEMRTVTSQRFEFEVPGTTPPLHLSVEDPQVAKWLERLERDSARVAGLQALFEKAIDELQDAHSELQEWRQLDKRQPHCVSAALEHISNALEMLNAEYSQEREIFTAPK